MTTKRKVALRPIRYSKLPQNVTIGLFNANMQYKQSVATQLKKAQKLCGLVGEEVIWNRWDKGEDMLSDIKFVVLFPNIPKTELKEIWYMTASDCVMKYKSFQKIYNQCVNENEVIWINCESSGTIKNIDQKIYWDRIQIPTVDEQLPPVPTRAAPPAPPSPPPSLPLPPLEPVISWPLTRADKPLPELPPLPPLPPLPSDEETSSEEDDDDSSSELTESSEEEYIPIPPPAPAPEMVNVQVTDITDEVKRYWTFSLPKKVTHIGEDVETNVADVADVETNVADVAADVADVADVETNVADVADVAVAADADGTCTIL